MTAADRIIRWSTALAVVGVAAVAALVSYEHASALVRAHGESVERELWLDKHDDMIHWEGSFYGDMELFLAQPGDKA